MNDDMLGTERVDQLLRRELGAAAPAAGDPDATLRELTPRFERARRRRRVAVTAGSLVAASVIVVVGAFAFDTGGGRRDVQVPPAGRGVSTTTPAPAEPSTGPSTTAVPTTPSPGGDGAATDANGTATDGDQAAAPLERTYTSPGGSLTIRLADGMLTTVSTEPAAGFAVEPRESGPDRIEVRFRSADREWRIRVEVRDGLPVEEITEHDR